MTYRLFTFFRSSASYRVRIALNLKNVDYSSIPVHLRRLEQRAPDYLERNPHGLVPVLADGDRILTQSLAIIEYLDETVRMPALLPEEPYARAVVRAMAQSIACDVHPLCNLRVLEYLRGTLGVGEDEIGLWYRHWVELGLEGLERLVERHSAGRYCFGDSITLADVCLVPQLYNARRFGCALERFERLLSIDAVLAAQPAFAAALPERQPDAAAH